jgi:muramoyltetrapeptide carboxypeptidase
VRDYADFEAGLKLLKNLDLQIRHVQPDNSGPDYLAADDTKRVEEIHKLWADDTVKGLMAARGGYGCLRIIDQLDLSLLSRKPKWLIGFSDLTVLLNGIYRQTGLITLHGPVVTSLPRLDKKSLAVFTSLLCGNYFSQYEHITDLEILRYGQARARLSGGNLATITHLIGTKWQPDFSGTLLFLEDTAEPAYKLDRMLTHLAASGVFDNLSGLILGFFDPGHDDRVETLRLNEHIWNRTLELCSTKGYPIWGGFPVGHQQNNYALPIGMEAVMDSATGSLLLDNSTCRITR